MVSGPISRAVGRLKKKKKTTPIVVVWFLVHHPHWILMLAIARSVHVQKSKLTTCNCLCKDQEQSCIMCMCYIRGWYFLGCIAVTSFKYHNDNNDVTHPPTS